MSAEIKVKVSADSTKLNAGLNQARAEAVKFGADLKSQFAGAFAAGAIMAGLNAAVQHYAKIGDLADRYGLARVELQKLGYAGENSGASLDLVANGLGKVSVSMMNAAQATGVQRDVFAAMGVTVDDLVAGNVSAEDVFYRTADAIKSARTDTERLTIANAVFGAELGQQLIPMLMQGGEALKALGAQAPVLSEEMVRMLSDADASMKEFKNTATVAFGYIAVGLNFLVEVARVSVTGWVSAFYTMFAVTERVASGIKLVLTGNFKAAGEEFARLKDDIAAGLETVAEAGAKFQAKFTTPEQTKAKTGGGDRSPTAEEKKALEEIEKLKAEIAAQDQKNADAKLTAQARLNVLTERHARLLEEANQAGLNTVDGLKKQLEASRMIDQIEREKKAISDAETKAVEEQAKLYEELDRIRATNNTKGETRDDKVARLAEQERRLREEADAADATGDTKGATKKRIEAEKTLGELMDMALADDAEAKKRPQYAAPTVDSLQAVGGGGGSYAPSGLSPELAEAKTGNAILREILVALKGRDEGGGGFGVGA